MKPLCIELFAGLHGWGEGFAAEGWRVVGFDLFDMCAELGLPRPEGDVSLVIQDVLTLHGSQFRNADCIVASPPCQAYSYRAMPWKRAKALPPPDNSLFEACFRIQREAIAAAGRFIPLIVENVKGAQKWVGRAAWHWGSFYLWGNVPALMPPTAHRKVPGMNFHEHEKTGKPGRSFQSAAVSNCGVKVPSASGRRTDVGKGARFTSRDCGVEAANSSGNKGFARRFEDTPMAWVSSKSSARKLASAKIAKIPFELSNWIARCCKPTEAAA